MVFKAMRKIGEQQGALILSPTRSQEHAGDFALWIVSVTDQARLAAKLEVIAEAFLKLKLDKVPNASVRFKQDLEEHRSMLPDAAMDVEWLEVQAEERRFAKYLVGEHGQLALRVEKTTGCQSFRCFEDSEAAVRPGGYVRVIACLVGDKLARNYGHRCVTWLLDQWKSGHYADISQSALENDPNITYGFVPMEQAKGRLKQRLLELQNETATLCFYQSTPKVERMKKECETLVIFSRDAASRDKAVIWLSEKKFGFVSASKENGH
jgi:hypothetical protein